MQHIYIKDFQPGEKIVSFYILNRAQFKTTKKARFIEFELQDKTGIIRGVYWDAMEEDMQLLENALVVKVQGLVSTYEERLQLTIERFRKAKEDDIINWDALIEISEKNIKEMQEYFFNTIEHITNPHIKLLLQTIFQYEEIRNAFFTAPAGKKFHHCYKHGLLEHVYNMLRIAKTMKEFYNNIDLDLLIAGIIFHDFGKIWEYNYGVSIDFSDIGRLHGHIAMGYHYVMKTIETISDFPDILKYEIGHLILSHQGELEKGSPVLPMTLEAIVLHHIDELDAKANAINRVLQKDSQPNSSWTNYNKLMGRYFYQNKENH